MSNQGSAQHHIISHDPATYQPEEVPKYIPTRRKKPMLVLATAGLLLITAGLVLLYLNKDRLLNQGEQTATPAFVPDDTVIATVGSEQIFAEDLNYELSFYPEEQRANQEQAIKERLITDSITLQGGADAGYIELDKTTFNALNKNRTKRQELIQKVTDAVNSEASYKTGSIVSIWFMNIDPGPIGYEQGKELAQQKINPLYQAVKASTMTMKQAGEAIKKDVQLAQVDPSYKENAYVEFDTRTSPEVTFDQTFNKQLRALDQGEITSLYLVKDYEGGEETGAYKDAAYMFGQVNAVSPGEGLTFDDWLAQQKETYAVTEE